MNTAWKWVLIYIGMGVFSFLVWYSLPRQASSGKTPLSWFSGTVWNIARSYYLLA
ncbi:MAG: hypothetical protein WCS27_05400 [Victivallaceae bacterium]